MLALQGPPSAEAFHCFRTDRCTAWRVPASAPPAIGRCGSDRRFRQCVGTPSRHSPQTFDAFVTTKLGRGCSHIGLHIVHNVVSSVLGGDVVAKSVEGGGPTFRVGLPLTATSLLAPPF
ncbi:ATP-binding protein [Niveibacterium sp.]|uniref:ATP-binding protein n=1 Tax=Niveibacterium sp. TaxID=2017444 RepID=UPI0035AF4BE6